MSRFVTVTTEEELFGYRYISVLSYFIQTYALILSQRLYVSLIRLWPFNTLPRAGPFSFPIIKFRQPGRFYNIESFVKRSG